MTLLMRDQENIEKGIQQGIQQGLAVMIKTALETTCSVRQTARILKLSEEMVRKEAADKGISVDD